MLSEAALTIIHQLNKAGFDAYAVGGCVRDHLRGIVPDDIDITTNALPAQTLDIFKEYRVIPTGLQHGTVTVLIGDTPFEVTTYRTDGTYTDGRHPDSVTFTASLEEDLARRDFTVNAIAFHPEKGIADPFCGQEDLNRGILRCVGDPATRFSEDALRIARLVRFMSVLRFQAEPKTAQAAHALCDRLSLVAAERKRVELMKLLMGDGFLEAATAFPDVMCRLVPSLSPLVGLDQHNPHHSFDAYTHTIRAVQAAAKDPVVRLAVLLHDLGKPQTFHTDEQGIGHFYGHPAVSEVLARETLTALRFDNATTDTVLTLVRKHDTPLTDNRKQIKRLLSKLGKDTLLRLLLVKEADASGCHENSAPPDFTSVRALIDDICNSTECFTLHELAVNGHDLLSVGIPAGPLLGRVLHCLLEAVIDDRCPNDRDALLSLAKECADDV